MSLVREMAPILTALMIGGRVGAGITAELGTMAVTEQIDAMRALGASPIRVLVVPRLLAIMVMLPLLTIIADLVGVLGGLLIATTELRVSSRLLLELAAVRHDAPATSSPGSGSRSSSRTSSASSPATTACHVTGGADGVGRATTSHRRRRRRSRS